MHHGDTTCRRDPTTFNHRCTAELSASVLIRSLVVVRVALNLGPSPRKASGSLRPLQVLAPRRGCGLSAPIACPCAVPALPPPTRPAARVAFPRRGRDVALRQCSGTPCPPPLTRSVGAPCPRTARPQRGDGIRETRHPAPPAGFPTARSHKRRPRLRARPSVRSAPLRPRPRRRSPPVLECECRRP